MTRSEVILLNSNTALRVENASLQRANRRLVRENSNLLRKVPGLEARLAAADLAIFRFADNHPHGFDPELDKAYALAEEWLKGRPK